MGEDESFLDSLIGTKLVLESNGNRLHSHGDLGTRILHERHRVE